MDTFTLLILSLVTYLLICSLLRMITLNMLRATTKSIDLVDRLNTKGRRYAFSLFFEYKILMATYSAYRDAKLINKLSRRYEGIMKPFFDEYLIQCVRRDVPHLCKDMFYLEWCTADGTVDMVSLDPTTKYRLDKAVELFTKRVRTTKRGRLFAPHLARYYFISACAIHVDLYDDMVASELRGIVDGIIQPIMSAPVDANLKRYKGGSR